MKQREKRGQQKRKPRRKQREKRRKSQRGLYTAKRAKVTEKWKSRKGWRGKKKKGVLRTRKDQSNQDPTDPKPTKNG